MKSVGTILNFHLALKSIDQHFSRGVNVLWFPRQINIFFIHLSANNSSYLVLLIDDGEAEHSNQTWREGEKVDTSVSHYVCIQTRACEQSAQFDWSEIPKGWRVCLLARSNFAPVVLTSRDQGNPAQHAFVVYLCAAINLALVTVMEFAKYFNQLIKHMC